MKEFICKECGKSFGGITNTHLATHNMTIIQYLQKYPKEKTQWNEGLTKETDNRVLSNAQSVKDSYTPELKLQRKFDAFLQFQDPEQREIRSIKFKGIIRSQSLEAEHVRLRKLLIEKRGNKCELCGKENNKKICLHHKDGRIWNNTEENGVLLCPSCHKKVHSVSKLTNKVENLLATVFNWYGINLNDENWNKTPTRYAKVLDQFLKKCQNEEIEEIFKHSFPSTLKDMTIIKEIPVFSFCPHHMLPTKFITTIGYIPNGRVLGLSKFKRVAKMIGAFPTLQEQYTNDLADLFMKYLDAKGVMVVVKGEHMCMRMRGIEQPDAEVESSAVRGEFEKHETRMEFLSLIGKD